MDRLTRGFHRIGLALAVPLLLIGAYGMAISPFEVDPQNTRGTALLFGIGGMIWYVLWRVAAWVINGFRETSA